MFETQIAEHEETTSASTKAIEEANKCASQLFPFTELDSDTARLVAKISQKVNDQLTVLNQTSRGVLNAAELARCLQGCHRLPSFKRSHGCHCTISRLYLQQRVRTVNCILSILPKDGADMNISASPQLGFNLTMDGLALQTPHCVSFPFLSFPSLQFSMAHRIPQ